VTENEASSRRVEIVDVVGGGRGLARVDDQTWLVAGGLPGERTDARPERRRAGVVEARVSGEVASRHPSRLPTPCPHSEVCGGCDWSHVDARTGAPLKAAVAAGAARPFPDLAARLRAATVHPSDSGYRLRARLHWDPGTRRLGFFGPRSWNVADITRCRVISPRLSAARLPLAEALADRCPARVDVDWIENLDGSGAVAALRPGRRGPRRLDVRWLPEPAAVGHAVDGFQLLDRDGCRLEGWGSGSVVMDLPVRLEVPVGAFFQGNRHLVRWLFDRIADAVGPEPVAAIDLHGGVGFLAAAAVAAGRRQVIVVEPQRDAATAAARNLPDATVHVGWTAEKWAERNERASRDVCVLLDPPRSGCAPTLVRHLASWRPRRIVMLSCDPATWARDAAALIGAGYRIDELELVDLFPHTHHVEVLSALVAP
jgi:23S rRNA (uracil1939-C5)-methyltransferase